MSLVSEEILVKALSRQTGVPAANLDAIQGVAPNVRAKIPREVARDIGAVPLQLRDENKTLVVAMIDPQNPKHLELLRGASKCKVIPHLAGRTALARAFGRF